MSECFFLFWVKIELFRQEVYAQKSLCSHKHSIRTRNIKNIKINHIRLLKLVNKKKLINFLTKKHISNDRDPQKKWWRWKMCWCFSFPIHNDDDYQPTKQQRTQTTNSKHQMNNVWWWFSFISFMDVLCNRLLLYSKISSFVFFPSSFWYEWQDTRQDMKPEIMMMIIINIMDVYY